MAHNTYIFLYYCIQLSDKKMQLTDKWFLICNPTSNRGHMLQSWPKVRKILDEEQIQYDFILTEYNNHAIEITQNMLKQGYRKIVILGGDGSINEVVTGIFSQNEVSPKDIVIALIPLGTANDWARMHSIPRDPEAAIRLLKTGKTRQQDIGKVVYDTPEGRTTRYFNNIAGMSYDAFVVKYIADLNSKKMNKLKYLFFTLYCLFKFKLPEVRVVYDGGEIRDLAYTINVGICKYNGGGMQLVPHAKPDDGLFALTFVRKLSKIRVVLNTYRFFTGTIDVLPEVQTLESTRVLVEPVGDSEVGLEVDGEFMGYAPAEFEILPGALNFIA
jgi:diacylglycerol kinase (ATP)